MRFNVGDRVYYTGMNRVIQQDYGKRELKVLAVDPKTRRVACATNEGHLLVGVNPEDIELLPEPVLQQS